MIVMRFVRYNNNIIIIVIIIITIIITTIIIIIIIIISKGILAADESTGTMGKRLAAVKTENTIENRRQFRNLLFTSEGLENYISGVILFEETVYQSNNKKGTLINVLMDKGIVPIIKVDKGLKDLPGCLDESITIGLDDLDNRCKEFYSKGCRAAKWRAVFNVSADGIQPSCLAVDENAHTLARYAAICQANGLVPIVEPEVLMDGIFDIETASRATQKVLSKVFAALLDHDVILEAALLKPNMVRSGSASLTQATAAEVAQKTFTVLSRTVPMAIGGIFFLSGGMSEESATICLNEINKITLKKMSKPWYLSFSYGRALQKSCLAAWQGQNDLKHIEVAQKTLLLKCIKNSSATLGNYDCDLKANESKNESNQETIG